MPAEEMLVALCCLGLLIQNVILGRRVWRLYRLWREHADELARERCERDVRALSEAMRAGDVVGLSVQGHSVESLNPMLFVTRFNGSHFVFWNQHYKQPPRSRFVRAWKWVAKKLRGERDHG